MRDEKLAAGLDWASLALGVPQTVAPRRFAQAVGVRPGDHTDAVVRYACGARELGAAAGILKISDPPTMWIWSRLAGDLFDLGLLASALAGKPRDRTRLTYAAAAVAGVAALDLFAAVRLSRQRKGEPPRHQETEETQADLPRDKVAITIRHPRAGLERLWRDHLGDDVPDWLEHATISFSDAPGDQGTEVLVQLGDQGRLAKLAGGGWDAKAKDHLRRFKQVVETGEIVRADGVPEGQSLFRTLKQRPGQPMKEEAGTR